MKKGIVTAVNISERKGIRKHTIPFGELIPNHGISGDAHAGNWHRQISLLAEESIDKMRRLGLSGLTPGAFAENIDTKGLDLVHLPVGTKLKIGPAVVQVTQIGKDCHNDGCAIQKAVGQCVMPREGIFVAVCTGGIVTPGDEIVVLEEPDDETH